MQVHSLRVHGWLHNGGDDRGQRMDKADARAAAARLHTVSCALVFLGLSALSLTRVESCPAIDHVAHAPRVVPRE